MAGESEPTTRTLKGGHKPRPALEILYTLQPPAPHDRQGKSLHVEMAFAAQIRIDA